MSKMIFVSVGIRHVMYLVKKKTEKKVSIENYIFKNRCHIIRDLILDLPIQVETVEFGQPFKRHQLCLNSSIFVRRST